MKSDVVSAAAEPRLFLSHAQWQALPQKLEDPYFRTIAENNRRALGLLESTSGLSILDVPHLLGEGEPRGRESVRVIRNRIARAAVAWYLEQQEQDLDVARRTLPFLLDRQRWTHGLPHASLRFADLRTGDLLYSAAFMLDVLGRYLSAEQRADLVACIRDLGLANYLEGVEHGDWWRRAEFNWGAALHGNAGLAALAIEPYEPALAGRVLAAAREGIRYVIDAFPSGGGWIEGIMYEGTAIGHLSDFAHALWRVCGDDLGLSSNRNFHDCIASRPYLVAPDGGLVNFSNCNDRTVEYPLPQVFWWADRCGREEWAGFEEAHTKDWRDTHGLFYDVEAFWFRKAHQPSAQPQLARMFHMRELDWMTWRGGRAWLAFRSGYNAGNHCNLDLGHFIFGAGADRFLCDPGYGAGRTAQHNAVTVRNEDQAVGATAKIFRLREMPGGFYLACDLSAAYPHYLSHHVRHLLLVDDAHLLVIDDLLGRHGKRTTAAFHLQTRLPWKHEGDRLTLKGQDTSLLVRFPTGHARFGVQEWNHGGPVTTLSWREPFDRVHNVHAMLLSLREEDYAFHHERDTAKLTVGGRTWKIDLVEGICGQAQM